MTRGPEVAGGVLLGKGSLRLEEAGGPQALGEVGPHPAVGPPRPRPQGEALGAAWCLLGYEVRVGAAPGQAHAAGARFSVVGPQRMDLHRRVAWLALNHGQRGITVRNRNTFSSERGFTKTTLAVSDGALSREELGLIEAFVAAACWEGVRRVRGAIARPHDDELVLDVSGAERAQA